MPESPRTSPPADDPRDFLTLPQACAYAQVSRRTLYNWMAAGKLTRYETPSGAARVRKSELVQKVGATE